MDLTKITTPFGLLDAETQQALKDCGGPWEVFGEFGWSDIGFPKWYGGNAYRKKPQPLTQDTIPWAQIDKRFKWAARDSDGSTYVYDQEPDCENCHFGWVFDGADVFMINFMADYRPGTCDWRDSLQQRPETD